MTGRRSPRSLAGAIVLVLWATSVKAQSRFPAAWAGEWHGTLTTVLAPDSVRNTIPISLRIAPEPSGSSWIWRTIFNADTVRGLRDYRLLIRDAARGHYAVDERNGVVLDETLVDGVLISIFQVGPQVLESRYSLQADTLVHDITFWNATPSSTTRGVGANAEGGVPIASYRVTGRQRARMVRR